MSKVLQKLFTTKDEPLPFSEFTARRWSSKLQQIVEFTFLATDTPKTIEEKFADTELKIALETKIPPTPAQSPALQDLLDYEEHSEPLQFDMELWS